MPKSKKPPLQLRQPGDSKAFNNANDMLESLGVHYRRPDPSHFKIGKINYYPSTGRTHIDGHRKAQSKRGLEALKLLLNDERARLGVYQASRAKAAEKRDREQRERDLAALETGDPKYALERAAARVDGAIRNLDQAEVDVGIRAVVPTDVQ